MKEHIEQHKTKYTIVVFIVLAAVIIIILLSGLNILSFGSKEKAKGSITVSFDDKNINSGKSTYMTIGAKNNGKVLLSGEFKITIDNPDEVKVNYPSPELLRFQLLPGESIERRINITGTSKAYKTYYKMTISIVGENTTYAKEDALLVVTND